MNAIVDTVFARQVREATNLSSLKTAMLSCARQNLMGSVLRELEVNCKWAESVAADSYEHDNGFSKIVLSGIVGEDHELRLHIWDGRQAPPSNVHNHTRGYVSIILTGSYVDQQFVVDSSGERFFQYRIGG